MKLILSLIIGGALVVSGFGQTRNVLVGTNNTVVQPTNFWSVDASNARAGLGLGTAATNPATAFQPSSLSLSNLALSNGGSLTNLNSTNLVGQISSSNLPTIELTNLSGVLGIISGGTGATNAETARTNLGLPWSGLTNSSASTFQTALFGTNTNLVLVNTSGVVVSPTNFWANSPISTVVQSFTNLVSSETNTVTNSRDLYVYSSRTNISGVVSTIQLPTNASSGDIATVVHRGLTNSTTAIRQQGEITNLISISNFQEAAKFIYTTSWSLLENQAFANPVYFSGTNATANAAASRTNLGLGATSEPNFQSIELIEDTNSFTISAVAGVNRTNLGLGATWLTNANVTNFRTAIGLGASNEVFFQTVFGGVQTNNFIQLDNGEFNGSWTFLSAVAFDEPATTRTNLGLGWSALTNSNTGTRLVSVDSNGSVVSPTNFWQVAPTSSNLLTIVQTFSPNTNSTNATTNGRNVYVYSLSTNVSGVTNTITLPTNAATLAGDTVTVTHQGLTNSTTAIRRLGETNNFITINNLDEAVKFIYENGDWVFYHNISFVEPIRFSGTNATANAAASRTNLGLGSTNFVTFGNIIVPNSTNYNQFGKILILDEGIIDFDGTGYIYNFPSINFANTNEAAITRTNLALGSTNDVTFSNVAASGFKSGTNFSAFVVDSPISGSFQFKTTNTNDGAVYLQSYTNSALHKSAILGIRGDDMFLQSSSTNVRVETTQGDLGNLNANTISVSNASATRTNLGLGQTNDVTFSNITASGTLTATGTVTATTNLVVNGFVDFSTNHTNATPVTPNTPARWLQIRVGTNVFYIPAHQ